MISTEEMRSTNSQNITTNNNRSWTIVVVDLKLNIVKIINPQSDVLLFQNETNLIGENINNLEKIVSEANKPAVAIISQNIHKVISNNHSDVFEFYSVRSDGSMASSIGFIEKGSNGLLYVHATNNEINFSTETNHSFTKNILNFSLNSLPVGIYIRIYNIDGTSQYLLFNDVARTIFGSSEVLKSENWNQADDDLYDEKILNEGSILNFEMVLGNKNEAQRFLSVSKKKIVAKNSEVSIITTLIDITSHKQNLTTLEQQYSILDSIFMNLPLGILMQDIQGNILSINKKNLDIFGIDEKEIINSNIYYSQLIPDDIKVKFRNNEDFVFELHINTDDIKKFFKSNKTGFIDLQIKANVVRNHKGEPCGYIQTCEDITEKKRIETKIAEKQLLIRSIYNSIPYGIDVYRNDGILIDTNEISMSYRSKAKEEVVGKYNIFDDPLINDETKQRIKNGKNFDFCIEYPTKNANNIYEIKNYDVKCSFITHNRNNNEAFILIFSDNTEKNNLSKQLINTQKYLKLALNVGKVATWKFEIKNKTFFSILGDAVCGESASYESIFKLVHRDDQAFFNDTFDQLISGKLQTASFVSRFYSPTINDYTYYESELKSEKDDHGNIIYIIGTQHDINEKTLSQQKLENYQISLDSVIEASNILMWDHDVFTDNYIILYGNKLLKKHPGLSPDMKNIHPDDKPLYTKIKNKIMSGESETESFVARICDENRDYFSYQITVKGFKSSQNQVNRIIGSIYDLSDQLQKNQILEETQKNLEIAITTGEMSVWSYNTNTHTFNIIKGSPIIKDGATYEDYLNFLTPDCRKDVVTAFDSVVSGKTESSKYTLKLFQNETQRTKYFQTYVRSIKNNGTADKIIGLTADITETSLQQIALERIHHDLEIALEAGKLNSWVISNNNRVFKALRGRSIFKENLTLDDLYAYTFPQYLDMLKALFEDVFSGKIIFGNTTIKIKSINTHEDIYVQLHLKGIKVNGVIDHIIGTTQDVTQSVRQKKELERNKEELKLALDAGNMSAWIYDVKKGLFSTIYGNTISDLTMTMKQNLELLHPDDHARMINIFEQLISGAQNKVEEVFRYRINATTNEYVYLQSYMVSTKSNGAVVKITGTQKNITESYIKQQQIEEYNVKTKLINDAYNVVQWEYEIENNRIKIFTDDIYSPEIITKEEVLCRVHPDDRDRFVATFESLKQDPSIKIRIEIRYRTSNSTNEFSHVEINGVALLSPDKKVIRYSGVRRDLTELVALNSNLSTIVQTNELILNNINVGLVFFTPGCQIKWSNIDNVEDTMEDMNLIRFKADEYCDMYENGKCSQLSQCIIKPAMETQKTIKKEIQTKNKVYEVSAIPAYNNNREISGALFKIVDITERKMLYKTINEAKDKALQSIQILHEIINVLPGAIFFKDVNNNFRYTMANKMFADTLNETSHNIIGKSNYEIYSKENADIYTAYDKKTVEQTHIEPYETIVDRNGKKVHWQISKTLITTADGSKLILGIGTDISNIHRINEELRIARIKAEQSDKLKSVFLANMSHEIRTPLNSIVGFSDLLQDTEDPQLKKEYCLIINSNSEMLLHLIGNILDLSKIEAGTMVHNNERINFSSTFNDLTTSLKQRLVNPQVEYIVKNPFSTCYITIDKNQISQIITNFVTNAIKYTPLGSITVGYSIDDNGLRVYVTDTGIGIADDKKDKVFQRFEKLDEFAQGTGLGLSIVKALTQSIGGKVGFKSKIGEGSTFWAWIPLNNIETSEYKELQSAKTKYDTSKLSVTIHNILVAEDNESNYTLMKYVLHEFVLTRAENGQEAVDLAMKQKFDVILMDMKMPILNGLEATKKIREFDKNVPIIAVTANAFSSDKDAALEAGCNFFISKPIKKGEILETFAQITQKSE